LPPAASLRPPLILVAKSADIEPEPEVPTHAMHPLAIRVAVVAAAWFVIAMALSFADSIEAAYLMAVVSVLAVVFFGLTLGLARKSANDPRWAERPILFHEWIRSAVGVATGRIAAREALVEVLTLPIALAIGATAIGLAFVFSR
jgi:hypothetical protein